MSILVALFVSLSIAYMLSELCKHLKLPRVIGQIATGILIGIPLIREYLWTAESIGALQSMANIGFVLLLFFAGLETNFSRFVKNLKTGASISFFNTLIPFLAGFVITKLFGFSISTALVVGIAFAVSAAAVAIDVLEELRILKTRFANTIMSVNAVDDIIEFVFIALILATSHILSNELNVLLLVIQMLVFLVSVVLFKSFIIPVILHTVEKEKSATALFYGAIVIALLMAALSDVLGFGSLIGALLAGILVRAILLSKKERRPWEEHEIAQTIHTITFGFFAPIFFISVGLNVNLLETFNIPFTLIIIVAALVTSLLGTVLGARVLGKNTREAWTMGLAFGNKGDTDLIVATIALQQGLITQSIFTSIVLMGLSTTIIATILFRIRLKKDCKYLKVC